MNIFVKKSAFWIITIIYGLTFLAICFPISLTIHTSVFFIGAILIAYIIDINLGLIFSCMFFVFSCIINKEITMDVLFFFLISLLLSILVQTIKGFLSVLLIECITVITSYSIHYTKLYEALQLLCSVVCRVQVRPPWQQSLPESSRLRVRIRFLLPVTYIVLRQSTS